MRQQPEWKVKFTCGCGYATSSADLAGAHAVAVGHTLTATGTVRPPSK